MAGAQVAIDLANSPSFEDKAALQFLRDLRPHPSGERRPQRASGTMSRYRSSEPIGRPTMAIFRAKVAQERLIRTSGIPIHHHPLDPVPGIPRRHCRRKCGWKTSSGSRPASFSRSRRTTLRPSLADVALAAPRNGIVEIAGRNAHRSTNSSPRYL